MIKGGKWTLRQLQLIRKKLTESIFSATLISFDQMTLEGRFDKSITMAKHLIVKMQ
jgi:hypothetical protein